MNEWTSSICQGKIPFYSCSGVLQLWKRRQSPLDTALMPSGGQTPLLTTGSSTHWQCSHIKSSLETSPVRNGAWGETVELSDTRSLSPHAIYTWDEGEDFLSRFFAIRLLTGPLPPVSANTVSWKNATLCLSRIILAHRGHLQNYCRQFRDCSSQSPQI